MVKICSTGLVPIVLPRKNEGLVSFVQSIEPRRILASTRDLNQIPLGPQSREVTTVLPLHTRYTATHSVLCDIPIDVMTLIQSKIICPSAFAKNIVYLFICYFNRQIQFK